MYRIKQGCNQGCNLGCRGLRGHQDITLGVEHPWLERGCNPRSDHGFNQGCRKCKVRRRVTPPIRQGVSHTQDHTGGATMDVPQPRSHRGLHPQCERGGNTVHTQGVILVTMQDRGCNPPSNPGCNQGCRQRVAPSLMYRAGYCATNRVQHPGCNQGCTGRVSGPRSNSCTHGVTRGVQDPGCNQGVCKTRLRGLLSANKVQPGV